MTRIEAAIERLAIFCQFRRNYRMALLCRDFADAWKMTQVAPGHARPYAKYRDIQRQIVHEVNEAT